MKKLIALVLSVLMILGTLGVAASASSVVGCDEPRRPTRPCPTTEAPTTVVVNNNTNVTQNVYVIEAESDPTTVMGFLYRIIKTLVPYLFKLLSMFSVTVSFNGTCSCSCNDCCNGTHCPNCDANNATNNNGGAVVVPDIVIPSVIVPTTNNGSEEAPTTDASGNNGGVLDQLFKDLFSGSGSES